MKGERILLVSRAALGALDVGSPSDGIYDAGEFHKHGIAGDLGNSSPMPGNVRLHDLSPQRPPAAHSFDIIKSDEARKTGNVSKGDRSKAPVNGRWRRRLHRQHGLIHRLPNCLSPTGTPMRPTKGSKSSCCCTARGLDRAGRGSFCVPACAEYKWYPTELALGRV